METIRAWWRYSRTIFLNGVAGLLVMFGEFLQFAIGFDWTSILPQRTAALMVVCINVANIILRYRTTKAVGQKDEA